MIWLECALRLFYASSSFEDMRFANCIQVRNMVLAFASMGDVTLTIKEGPEWLDWPKNVTVKRFKTKGGRLENLCYSLWAFKEYSCGSRSFDYVYSRNPLFSLLGGTGKGKPIHGFEFHTFVEGSFYEIVQKQIMNRTNICVTINRALKDRLRKLAPEKERRIFVSHDAHANRIVHQMRTGIDTPPRVGYFGSINDLKGERILRELIHQGKGFKFYVYSADLDRLKSHPNLVEYRYLPHYEVFTKMAEMDFLLLITEPRGTNRDITPYTSPLKLFEYVSVAGVVLASNMSAIREIIHHKRNGYLVDNSPSAWLQALETLTRDRALYSRISAGAIETAANHTWESRARRIIDVMASTY